MREGSPDILQGGGAGAGKVHQGINDDGAREAAGSVEDELIKTTIFRKFSKNFLENFTKSCFWKFLA